jgi:LCP family protein required for cell wall assembly
MDRYKHTRPERRVRQTLDGFIGGPPPLPRQSGSLRTPAPAPIPQVTQQRRLQAMDMRMPAVAPVGQPAPARRLPSIDMQLEQGAPATHHGGIKLIKKWSAVRKWSFRTAVASLVLLIGVGGFLFSQGYFNVKKVFRGTGHAASLQENVDPNLLKGEGDGRINVLLLGRGGAGHDAPDLTDTIMLASIDPVNHTAQLLSIPRDLWVTIPKAGSMKLNAAWETGKYKYLHKMDSKNMDPKAVQAGFTVADQTIEDIVGVPIHYNMLLDFKAFKQAVDTVGGVNVNVPETLYDPTMAWENRGNPVLAKAGNQTFDGKHALIYVRSRETSSDFARSQRQRSVMLALKDKAATLGTLSNPTKLAGLMNAFGKNVQTDFSLGDATRMYSIFKSINNTSVQSLDLVTPPHSLVTTGNINGQSVVLPRAGQSSYDDIQKYVRSSLKDGYILKENAKIMVLNGTGENGLGTKKADELKSYGYNITGVATAPTNGYNETILVDLTKGKKKYTKHYLEQRFNITATTTLPDTAIAPGTADFILVVGSDESSSI